MLTFTCTKTSQAWGPKTHNKYYSQFYPHYILFVLPNNAVKMISDLGTGVSAFPIFHSGNNNIEGKIKMNQILC